MFLKSNRLSDFDFVVSAACAACDGVAELHTEVGCLGLGPFLLPAHRHLTSLLWESIFPSRGQDSRTVAFLRRVRVIWGG